MRKAHERSLPALVKLGDSAPSYLAYDTETIPAPEGIAELPVELTPGVSARDLTKIAADIKRLSVDFRRARIVAAGVYGLVADERIENAWVAPSLNEEKQLLQELWDLLRKACRSNAPIVTFNGLAFDVPLLYSRSSKLGVLPAIPWTSISYPYRTRPHFDLRWVLGNYDRRRDGTLEDYCRMYGIESPKGELHGALVLDAYLNERWYDIKQYVLADARATGELFERVGSFYC